MLIGGGTVMGVSLLSVAGLTSSNGPLPTAKANACVGLSESRHDRVSLRVLTLAAPSLHLGHWLFAILDKHSMDHLG